MDNIIQMAQTKHNLTQADMEAAAYIEKKLHSKLHEQAQQIKQLQAIVEAYRLVAPGLLVNSVVARKIIRLAQEEAAWEEHEATAYIPPAVDHVV